MVFLTMASILREPPLVARIVGLLGTLCSILGLAFTLKPFSDWGGGGYALLSLGVMCAIAVILMEVGSTKSRRVFPRSDSRRIRDYMAEWIGQSGPVVIWTRDHSWVDDDKMRSLLFQKAESGELTLCVPKATDLTTELETVGAEVVAHGLADPGVRFTIVDANKGDFAVALARPAGRQHVIEEYTSEHASASLARDMVALARVVAKSQAS